MWPPLTAMAASASRMTASERLPEVDFDQSRIFGLVLFPLNDGPAGRKVSTGTYRRISSGTSTTPPGWSPRWRKCPWSCPAQKRMSGHGGFEGNAAQTCAAHVCRVASVVTSTKSARRCRRSRALPISAAAVHTPGNFPHGCPRCQGVLIRDHTPDVRHSGQNTHSRILGVRPREESINRCPAGQRRPGFRNRLNSR